MRSPKRLNLVNEPMNAPTPVIHLQSYSAAIRGAFPIAFRSADASEISAF